MPRRAATKPRRSPTPAAPARRHWGVWVAVGVVVVVIVAIGIRSWNADRPRRLLARAEAETAAEDWPAALRDWRALNQTPLAGEHSYLAEAKACLALGRIAQADVALGRAIAARPSDPEPWLLRLEIERLEDRALDAIRDGWAAYAAVPPGARRDVLRALTLALLAQELPADPVRRTLQRAAAADPADITARVALARRQSADPEDGDPPRFARIVELETLLKENPGRGDVREALIEHLADAGDPERGRAVLDAWPADERDARYDRLRGRWDLEYDHQPARAVESLRRALLDLPHDWRTHYRLARALRTQGRPEAARAASTAMARVREALEPGRLGKRLDADLGHLDEPRSRNDLAELCERVGLTKLAEAWREDAGRVEARRGL